MNKLWFVKYDHKTQCEQVVFLFTLPADSTEEDAFAHGRSMINPDYAAEFKDQEATRVCHTEDTVLCFEPC